jgi:hypothetical protein
MCVKYPTAVPKPAPPKITEEDVVILDNPLDGIDLRCIVVARFQKIDGVRTANRSAPIVA